jgi:DNA mismatch endonuclease (patch repair protein)
MPFKLPDLQFRNLKSASAKASAAARGASKKGDTLPELLLRRALWRLGYRYRTNVAGLPGRPDIVFVRKKIAIFCDGDFWHGKDWSTRKKKLRRGHNSEYWIGKIGRNMRRDIQNQTELENLGWRVLRYWESDILTDVTTIVGHIVEKFRPS